MLTYGQKLAQKHYPAGSKGQEKLIIVSNNLNQVLINPFTFQLVANTLTCPISNGLLVDPMAYS